MNTVDVAEHGIDALVEVEPKTKEQIAQEKADAKALAAKQKADDKIVKFYTSKQKAVYATGHIIGTIVEHHKYNTLKDAEDNFNGDNLSEHNGVIVEYVVSRILRPVPVGKGKKKQYETIADFFNTVG